MKIVLRASLFAVFAAIMVGCHGGESASPAVVETMQARVVQSQQQQVPLKIRSTGTVHARETAVVSAQVVGRIQQVLVREGDSVRAGQPLAVLDDAALRASVDQAQAGVKAAQEQRAAAQTDAMLAASTLDRYRQLQAEKSVSPQEMHEVAQRAAAASARLEAVRSQTDAARAQETGAHTMLGYTRLVAPFAGVVTARMADPGTLASPGVPHGKIHAVDAQDEMLLLLRHKLDEAGISNVDLIHAEADNTGLAAGSCDLFFAANIWREFEDCGAVLKEAARLLKAGGQIAILDWRTDAPPEPGPPVTHRLHSSNAVDALRSCGFQNIAVASVGLYSWLVKGEMK